MEFFSKKVIRGCEGRGDADSAYLTRYTLIGCDLFRLAIHKFHRSDADDLHDHPFNFWTLILWGGYKEQVITSMPYASNYYYHKPGTLLYRPATHTHRVILHHQIVLTPETEYTSSYRAKVVPVPCYTLVLMTKRIREWGFLQRGCWIHWRQYFRELGC